MPERLFPSEMYSLEIRSAVLEPQNLQNSLLNSLLAGNLGRERLAPDCLLRQQVLTAEKLPRPLPRNTQNMPVFRNISSAKRTGENGLIGIEWPQSAGLSLAGTSAVRFQRLYRANATRSQTDDVAKVT